MSVIQNNMSDQLLLENLNNIYSKHFTEENTNVKKKLNKIQKKKLKK